MELSPLKSDVLSSPFYNEKPRHGEVEKFVQSNTAREFQSRWLSCAVQSPNRSWEFSPGFWGLPQTQGIFLSAFDGIRNAGGLYLGGNKKVFIHICAYSKFSLMHEAKKPCFASLAKPRNFFFMALYPKVLYKIPPHHRQCHLLQHSYSNCDSYQMHRGVPFSASYNPHCTLFNKPTGDPRIWVACPASHR